MSIQLVSDSIQVIPNFPSQGIYYRDVSPLLKNTELRNMTIDLMAQLINNIKIDYIAGIESRGFIFGMGLAQKLGIGFVMLRKPNKMPNTIQVSYSLEHEKDILTIQKDAIEPGKNVLIVDDLLATGETLVAGCELIEQLGANIVGCLCLIELTNISRKEKLNSYKLFSLIKYPASSESKLISKSDLLLLQKRKEYLSTDNFLLDSPLADDDRIVLFSHPSMKSIAENIINTSSHFRKGTIVWNHFPDGYPNIRFEHLKYLENKRVVFIGSLYDQTNLLEQLSMIMVLPRQFIKSMDIIFPYFAPGTMERVDEEGILATAETMAKILSSCLPVTKQGLPILHIYDLHALPVRHYFPDSVIVRMESAIPLLKQKISKNITIAFPDEGAAKRFKFMFSDYKTIVCSKIREGNLRNIKIVDKWNWPLDDSKCLDDVLIIDDLVQSGGTLEECRKALHIMGAKKISAYVTHAVFPNKNYTKFFNGNFHKFYITNSIPEISNELEGKAPFEIIKLDELIKNTLMMSYEIKSIETAPQTNKYTIYVASTNEQKLKAAHDSFLHILDSMYGDHINKITVYGVDVSSDVSEQPINEETMTGCINRLDNLKSYLEHHNYKYDFIVSVENGISCDENNINEDSKIYDFCCTTVLSNINGNTRKFSHISEDKTYFPPKYLIASLESNKTITAGSLIEKDYGVKSGTWHQLFCDFTRLNMMTNSLEKCLKSMCWIQLNH